MRIKSYFAGSVAEAMEKARRDLGPEAMLMNSKKTELELRSLGSYEVVFAVPPEAMRASGAGQLRVPAPPASVSLLTAARPVAEARDPAGDLARELAELRKQIETVKRSVDRRPPGTLAGSSVNLDGPELLARLTAADISEELAGELANAIASRRGRGAESESLEAALRSELESRLRLAPSLGMAAAAPRALLLAGPSGVGKTTTLVKLALRYGLRARLPLQLLSLDTLRIGGWEQLASYARIAGIPCQAIHTPAALNQAFAEHRDKKLLFIDTPGGSPADEAQSRSLAAWLSAHRSFVEVQLVLSGAVLPRVNLAAIERFSAFAPAKLLFTHLDETESPGPLLETALRGGLPLSFLATGPQVPEDLEEASLDRLLGSLAGGGPGIRRIASAA